MIRSLLSKWVQGHWPWRVLWHRLVHGEFPVTCNWCAAFGRVPPNIIHWSHVEHSSGICPQCKVEFEAKEAERERQLKRNMMSVLEATEEWFHL